jgi:hypothetical protein
VPRARGDLQKRHRQHGRRPHRLRHLLIAHHLSLGGDTMEMMRAVLDSNFWLATHVVTVTIGYSATFLAGFLGLMYILRGVFTRRSTAARPTPSRAWSTASSASRSSSALSAPCSAGSGPTNPGAASGAGTRRRTARCIIVLWNALILHARWGGWCGSAAWPRGLRQHRHRWSWFGVNMLGVGLHSYGFMGAAFWWLILFGVSQVGVMLIGAVPLAKWRSFAQLQPATARPRRAGGVPLAVPETR